MRPEPVDDGGQARSAGAAGVAGGRDAAAPDLGAIGTAPAIAGYRPMRLLGDGGFAEVFLYEYLDTGGLVAVKVLKPQSPDRVEAVRQQITAEAKALGRLSRSGSHPHLVTVHTVGQVADRPYLIMEYCPGGSLAQALAAGGRFEVSRVLRIGVQIAGALQTAHLAGIVHRDVKPGNVLLGLEDDDAKLGDFGIAALTADEVAGGSDWLSVHYSAPEVLDGWGDQRADVYALAATLYELLAGHPPFKVPGGDNRVEVVQERIRAEQPPRFARPDIPASLHALLLAALTKDPQQRGRVIGSARKFAQSLNQIQRECGYRETSIRVHDPGSHARTAAAAAAGTVAPAVPAEPGQSTADRPRLNSGAEAPADRSFGDRPRQGVFAPAMPDTEPKPGLPQRAAHEPVTPRTVASGRGAAHRRFAIAAAGTAVALVLMISWSLWSDQDGPSGRPAASPSVRRADADALDGLDVAVPVPVIEVKRQPDGSVRFAWHYNGLVPEDFFQVERTDSATAEPSRTSTPEWVVAATPAERPCIQVRVIRRGRASDAVRACAS